MRNTIRKIKNISLRIRAMKQYMEGLNHHVSYEEALVELEKFSPNPHTSCYCLGSDIKWGKYDLTVIIPSYNNEKFLPTCLDSIADQSRSLCNNEKRICKRSVFNAYDTSECYSRSRGCSCNYFCEGEPENSGDVQ